MKYRVTTPKCVGGEMVTLSAGKWYTFGLITGGSAAVSGIEEDSRCGVETMVYVGPGRKATLRPDPEVRQLRLVRVDLTEELLEELSDHETDLVAWLENVGPVCRVLKPDCAMLALARNVALNLAHLPLDPPLMGDSIYERGLLSVLAVLLARACRLDPAGKPGRGQSAFVPDAVLGYIARHITEEITLERLEKQFFTSRSYISREFKMATGQTVHRYILLAKLELCKKYIAQGMAVTEVCKKVEVGGYNNFFRAFKKEYNLTPGEYYAQVHRGKTD